MVKRHLSLLVVAVACIALLGDCASKYGAQTTQVNYYPQCYSPVAQLRADEDRVNNSTAGGAAGGALLGALIGGLATGKLCRPAGRGQRRHGPRHRRRPPLGPLL